MPIRCMVTARRTATHPGLPLLTRIPSRSVPRPDRPEDQVELDAAIHGGEEGQAAKDQQAAYAFPSQSDEEADEHREGAMEGRFSRGGEGDGEGQDQGANDAGG